MDCFYKELTDEEYKDVGKYNFDHPDAMDWELIKETLQKLLRHEDVMIPNYNYTTCKRDPPGLQLKCTDLILFEGIFSLFDAEIRAMMDLKIFVHSDDDIRLLRRLKRDVMHRGRTIEGVIKSYNRFVKASFDEYIKPTMKYSDIIVPRGGDNPIAIQFITENLKNRLKNFGLLKAQSSLQELPFDIVDQEIKDRHLSILHTLEFEGNKKLYEKILLKMIDGQDEEMLPLQMVYLSKSLIDLLKKKNSPFDYKEWSFINQKKDTWQNQHDLNNCLEQIEDPQSCKHVALFLPELVSRNFMAKSLINLCEILKQFSFIHSIEKVHVLTPFLGSDFLKSLTDDPKFQTLTKVISIDFYCLYLSDSLKNYPCFISDVHHHNQGKQQEDIDITSQSPSMKIQAFNMKGQLDPEISYQSFYGQDIFK